MNRNNGLRESMGGNQAAQMEARRPQIGDGVFTDAPQNKTDMIMTPTDDRERILGPIEDNDGLELNIKEHHREEIPQPADYPNERLVEDERSNPREIHIEPLNYGYLVTVGCQKMAIETPEKLSKKLLHYLKNVNAVENEFPRLSFLAD